MSVWSTEKALNMKLRIIIGKMVTNKQASTKITMQLGL